MARLFDFCLCRRYALGRTRALGHWQTRSHQDGEAARSLVATVRECRASAGVRVLDMCNLYLARVLPHVDRAS